MSSNLLYQALLATLDTPPDLTVVQNREPCPETWPLLLEKIDSYRGTMRGFTVSDGQISLSCHSDLPETNERLRRLELGSVVHLVGAQPCFDEASKTYTLVVDSVLTLKEYDAQLQEQREREAQKAAETASQLESTYAAYLGA